MALARADSDAALAAMLPACLADLRVVVSDVPDTLQGCTAAAVLWQAAQGALLLEIPDLARLLIRRDEIMVTPLAPDALSTIGSHLRATPFAAAMFLRGQFACNAAAIAGPNGAVLIFGETASGKSSLAVALMRRGLRLLADDAAPLGLASSGKPVVTPVWPEMVLWPDAVAHLFGSGIPAWLAPRLSESSNAPFWDVRSERFCAAAMPLKAVYRVRRVPLSKRINTLSRTGLAVLRSGTLLPYHGMIAAALVDPAALLRIYGGVTAHCPIVDVELPTRSLEAVDDLADQIMRDCGWPISI